MPTYKILLSAPYMLPFVERFRPVFAHYDCELIIPQVNERLEAPEILQYAGQFDGTAMRRRPLHARGHPAVQPALEGHLQVGHRY